LPLDPNRRFKDAEGFDVLFAVGSASHRKFCVTADAVSLSNEEACTSSGFELKPWLVVAAPSLGITAPEAVIVLVKVPVEAFRLPLKVAAVPLRDPLSEPPLSCR
jgi:hypothetical protein